VTREPRNLAASVRERLFQLSKARKEDFQLVLQRYAVERLLFRLERSPDQNRFILKGAMLYLAWGEDVYRPTRDLDLLGLGPAEPGSVAECFRTVCTVEAPDDGLTFLPSTVRAEQIREGAEYGGVRVRVQARLGSACIDLQVDVGFGDSVVPAPQEIDFPTLLGGPAPRIRAYPRESVVAEKLHAAALLGDTNTRMKDFYDLLTLSRLFPFQGPTLTRAIAATFERRQMPLPATLPLSASYFADDTRAGRWRAYLDQTRQSATPRDFAAVGEALREFLGAPYTAVLSEDRFRASWVPGGPWR
jgi:hypothetical protein